MPTTIILFVIRVHICAYVLQYMHPIIIFWSAINYHLFDSQCTMFQNKIVIHFWIVTTLSVHIALYYVTYDVPVIELHYYAKIEKRHCEWFMFQGYSSNIMNIII